MTDKRQAKKKLRSGYTTGVCAAAAAKAATMMLLAQEILPEVTMQLPDGNSLTLPLADIQLEKDIARCAVKKDSGDDPDITNGIMVCANVARAKHSAVTVDGGIGIGRVTKPGLACNVGEPAINPVPRAMILTAVEAVRASYCYPEGLDVIISVPEGEKIAPKTFNPRLGIIGGISILGTTGIVEPMSSKAWTETIYLEMKQQYALGVRDLIICPGNYGQDFIRNSLHIRSEKAVKCSNYIGEALDFALELSFDSILLIGHTGKVVKLAMGIMNTHSQTADARMETLALHAALQGASTSTIHNIMNCNTTEEGALLLQQEGILEPVFSSIMAKAEDYVHQRVHGQIVTAVVMFSNELGIIGKTRLADQLISIHQA